MTPTLKSPRVELVGTFDAGGIQSIENIQVTNGTVSVGQPDSQFEHLHFVPGQTNPLPVTATRTQEAEDQGLPLYWSFDAVDVAGNRTHCHGVKLAPLAQDDSYDTSDNTPVNVSAPGVLANDIDPRGDPLSAVLVSGPAHGTVQLNGDGSFVYVPHPLFTGTDSFVYEAQDGYGGDTAVVSITVAPANRTQPLAKECRDLAKATGRTVLEPKGLQQAAVTTGSL
jgi:hypothetical protein